MIQKQKDVESYLDTAWTVSVIRSFVLFLLLFFIAPLIAQFFNSSESASIIRVLAISFLLTGFRNIGIIYFQKEMEFGKSFFYEISSTIVNLALSITLAVVMKDVWALVWGSLAGGFGRLFMSYTLHPYRPRFRISRSKLKDLFGFGKWVLGSSILVFFNSQGDDIFVGKILGVAALGFYQMAYLISNLPATEITHIISKVTYPAYTKLQTDLTKFGQAFIRIVKLTSFISIPVGGAIFVLAPDFTRVFFGDKWMPMVPAIEVLVLWGVLRSLVATTGPAFYGFGKPDLAVKLQFFHFILLMILIYPLSRRMGIVGTSLSVILSAIFPNIIAFHKVLEITRSNHTEFIKELVIPFMATLVSCAFVKILKAHAISFAALPTLLLAGIIFTIDYLALISFFEKFSNYRIWPMIKDLACTAMT